MSDSHSIDLANAIRDEVRVLLTTDGVDLSRPVNVDFSTLISIKDARAYLAHQCRINDFYGSEAIPQKSGRISPKHIYVRNMSGLRPFTMDVVVVTADNPDRWTRQLAQLVRERIAHGSMPGQFEVKPVHYLPELMWTPPGIVGTIESSGNLELYRSFGAEFRT